MPRILPKARGGPLDCQCLPLHYYCDLGTCSEARSSRTELKRFGAKEPLFLLHWGYLVDSADAGCYTCEMVRQIVRQGVSTFENRTFEDDRKGFRSKSVRGYRYNGTLVISWDESLAIECCQSAPSNCRALQMRSFDSRATGNALAFEQCRKWVSDCSQNHVVCRVGNTVLPRRVVDIGHIREHKFFPRLIESDNHVGEYSTLSHCWGSSGLLTTTMETLADRKLSIPWDLLSKTFRDAIIVTHELGLRYMWIDSLCIIQDNFADWNTESKNMAAIYGNSKVTIAAVKSKDGTGGLFQEDEKVVSFTYNHINTSLGTSIAIRKWHQHGGYQTSDSIDADSHPLFTRGWTLQEELLAPRVLYYGSEEIVFQCRELTDCQCGRLDKEAKNQKRLYEEARKVTSKHSLMRHWARLLGQYTTRFLTIETDRFPALSGLISAFENQGLGEYVAGLWTMDLPMWLAWESERGKLSNVYVAPSWSWASLAGPNCITYNEDLFVMRWEPYLKILTIGCEPRGLDPRGAITSGYLTVRGRVVFANVRARRGGYRVERGKWGTGVKLDCGATNPEHDYVLDLRVVHCLLLLRDCFDFYFLVLIGDQNGRYKRIGIGCTQDLDCLYEVGPGNSVVKTSILNEWFKDTDEQEVTLV